MSGSGFGGRTGTMLTFSLPRHCIGGEAEAEKVSCERVDRDYNIPLRIGLLFVILLTSAIGVFTPVLLAQFSGYQQVKLNSILLVIKQFGTGIVISTAFIHVRQSYRSFLEADYSLTVLAIHTCAASFCKPLSW